MRKTILFINSILIALTLVSVSSAYTPGGCQCTDYVKDNIPEIRNYDLTSLDNKKSRMNMEFPAVNSMAVHDLGTYYGHVSVVRNVSIQPDGSMLITIQEKNLNNKCDSTGTTTITTRTDTAKNLKIIGFFNPTYTVASSYPKFSSISTSTGNSNVQFWTTASGSGFEANSAQAMIFGGWCDAWAKCVVPNNVMSNKSSTSLAIPLTLGQGTYHLYIFNQNSGKTSGGQKITIY